MGQDKRLQLRITGIEQVEWKRKAVEAGQTLTDWIRERCNEAFGGQDGRVVADLLPPEVTGVVTRDEPKKPKAMKDELAVRVAGRTAPGRVFLL
jgi:hypothetical protein